MGVKAAMIESAMPSIQYALTSRLDLFRISSKLSVLNTLLMRLSEWK